MKKLRYLGFSVVLGAACTGIQAQTCEKPADTQWLKVTLVDASSPVKLDKPIAMSILQDGRVFVAEMWSGAIKLVTPGSGAAEVGKLAVYADAVENGLLGIAADPQFATNNWVYILYSRQLNGATYSAGDGNISPHEHVLVRMTLTGGKLGNTKELLTFPRLTKRHSAGGLTFNKKTGDLYIPTGDDVHPLNINAYYGARHETIEYHNDLRTAANTNDLRGKVLRIRPLPFPDSQTPAKGVGTTYAIPAGNLFPPNMAKTRPEIYTMGHRNPYKIKIDTGSGFALIGEVGPDASAAASDRGPAGMDEFNLVTKAGNFGWPFGIGNNTPYIAHDNEAYPKGTVFDLNNLKNLSRLNTGLTELPPAIPALGYYNAVGNQGGTSAGFGAGAESAIAGPYYRYDPTQPAVRMPAYFHGKFIAADWSRGRIWALEMNPNNTLKKVEMLWSVGKVIDLDIGPKGELYVLTLSSGGGGYEGPPNSGLLYKMEFTGTHIPASSCPQYVFDSVVGVQAAAGPGRAQPQTRVFVNLALTRQVAAPAGKSKGILFGLNGGKIWEGQVREGWVALPAHLSGNLGFMQFK